jgi:amino acid transporter
MQQDTRERTEQLVRQFSVLGLWVLVVNGILGAGIFGLPAKVAAATGEYSALLFVACGVLIAPIVLSFAEAASYVRTTGGPVVYVGTVFGSFASFQTGWAMYASRATAFAANVNLLADSLGWLWPGASSGATRVAIVAGVCGLLTLVNVIGSKQAMRTAGILTVLKLAPILLLVVAGLAVLSPRWLPHAGAPLPSMEHAGAAVLMAMYAFVGWEVALVPAGEARDPRRDLPRALLLGLASVALLYVLIQIVCVAALPDLASSKRPLVDAAEVIAGSAGASILLFGTVASIAGNLAVSMISGPRTSYALALDGSLPAFFGSVHARYKTPAASVIVYGVLVTALALSGTFASLLVLSVLARVLVFLLVIAALPKLRARFGSENGTFRLPGGYVIPCVAGLVCFGLAFQAEARAVWTTLAFLGAGSLLYFVARRRR